MKATEILMQEHVVIKRVLAALEHMANRAAGNEPVRAGFFLEAADFIKYFADGCHHNKEEGVLFIALNAAGMPIQGSPIGVMLAEHEQGRAFTRRMREAAQEWEKGVETSRTSVIENALGYVSLLRQHIYKEDNILFPMAERTLTLEKKAQVDADFEQIGRKETSEGIQEKYLALAEALEMESSK